MGIWDKMRQRILGGSREAPVGAAEKEPPEDRRPGRSQGFSPADETGAGKVMVLTPGKYVDAGRIADCLLDGYIMRGWMNDERVMIACCSDGTRPVIFKIERMDYQVLHIDGIACEKCRDRIREALFGIAGVTSVVFRDGFTEVYVQQQVTEDALKAAVEDCGAYTVLGVE